MEIPWTRTIVDADAFHHEQKCLAHVWTFLGLTVDVSKDGDWFTASLATRSVFVQRFGTELRGFENQCAHRGHPLRIACRGHGPAICPYHHWQYDGEGRAVGIPYAREMFGALPLELGARLNGIELAVCGTLIFGRFPAPGVTQSLEDFIGEGLPFLKAASQINGHLQCLSYDIAANWHLCMHISLDDYHSPAVHPSSFGKGGYLHRKDISYRRFGLHNAFLSTARVGAFEDLLKRCSQGTFRPTSYVIFNILPNFFLVLTRIDFSFFHGVILVYDPVQHDLTKARAWLYPAPFHTNHAWLRRITEPIRAQFVRRLADRILREDNIVCERLQQAAIHIRDPSRVGALEQRILWFEESCRRLIVEGEAYTGES